MDTRRFDALAGTAARPSRRGILRLLAALGLGRAALGQMGRSAGAEGGSATMVCGCGRDCGSDCCACVVTVADEGRPASCRCSCQPCADPGVAGGEHALLVDVDARLGWQETGAMVEAGATVAVRVVGGEWTEQRGRSPYNPGTGGTYVCAMSTCVEALPGFPKGALIAQVGDAIVGIGAEATFVAQESGPLRLRINDSTAERDWVDNDGVLVVQVTIATPAD